MRLETAAHNLVSLEGPSLIKAIKDDFGLEISNPEKVIHGYSSQVYKAQLKNEIVFVRINKRAQMFEAEILGYDILKNLGIPVPELISYQAGPMNIGHPTMIIAAAEGVSVGEAHLSPEQDDKAYEQIGELVRKIHSVKIEGFGTLESANGELKGKFKNWREYYDSREGHHQKSLEYLLGRKLITQEEAQRVGEAHQKIISTDFGKASLLHLDISGSHVFTKDGKISGVIDLGKLLAGDPRYDIAVGFVFQTSRQRESFKKGYGGELVNDPLVLEYLLTIAARKAAFRFETGTQEGGEKALRILRETLIEIESSH